MKKIGLVFSLVLFFSISSQVNAQWELQNPKLTNLDILDISYLTSNSIILVGEDGIILKSSNGGQSFDKQVHSSLKDFVSVSFSSSLNGWAVSSEGIAIKTTDGGSNWVDVFIDSNRKYFSVCFIDDEKGFIGSDSGIIYSSTDGGNSWDTLRTQLNNSITDIRFTNSLTGYAVKSVYNDLSRYFIFTKDGGINWSTRNFPLDPNAYSFLFDSLIYVVTNGQIYKSTDSGLNWILISNSIGADDIFFISENKGWLIHPTGEIFVTTNGGVNWKKELIASPFFYGWNYKIEFINENEGIIIGKDGMVFKTTDGGDNWLTIDAATVLDIITIDFINDQVGFALGYRPHLSQVIKTTNKGENWDVISEMIDTTVIEFTSIDFYTENLGIIVGNWGFAKKTTNGGISWEELNIGSHNDLSDVKIMDDTTYYLFGPGVIYKTTDSGNTWSTIQTGLSSNLRGIYFNGYIGYAQSVGGGVLIRSFDYGENWEILNIPPSSISACDFVSDEIGFLGGYYGSVYKTTDYGDNWVDISIPNNYGKMGIDFINENEGWCVTTDSKILHTTDSGTNWSLQNIEGNNKLKNVLMLNSDEGWIIGNHGLIYHTTNGGVTFIEEENNPIQPKQFLLQQNYPNPFNPSTKISWQAPVSGWQTLKVYDILGNEVATLVDEYRNAGSYNVEFRMQNLQLSSGVYFYQLRVGDYLDTKKMILLK